MRWALVLRHGGIGRYVAHSLVRAGIWRCVDRLPYGLVRVAVLGVVGVVALGWLVMRRWAREWM